MTATYLEVTSGSGTKLAANSYTEASVTVLDQKLILGEPYLASYTLSTLFNAVVSTATANSHLLEIMAGASLRVRIRRIEMHQTVAATTATLMDTRLFRVTTAGTGGTAVGTAALDPADGGSGATAMTLPTVKGTEGTGILIAAPYMMQTVVASNQLNEPILVWDFDRPRSKPLIIAAGTTNGICVKNATAVAAGNVTIAVWFDETTF